MHAEVGDQLRVRGRVVGAPGQRVEVLEVKGQDGSPPYLVRHDDGHEALMFPGPDTSVEHASGRG